MGKAPPYIQSSKYQSKLYVCSVAIFMQHEVINCEEAELNTLNFNVLILV